MPSLQCPGLGSSRHRKWVFYCQPFIRSLSSRELHPPPLQLFSLSLIHFSLYFLRISGNQLTLCNMSFYCKLCNVYEKFALLPIECICLFIQVQLLHLTTHPLAYSKEILLNPLTQILQVVQCVRNNLLFCQSNDLYLPIYTCMVNQLTTIHLLIREKLSPNPLT